MSKPAPSVPQAQPVDQESSLFTMTPEQHQAMVEQTRQQFMAQRRSTAEQATRATENTTKGTP